MAQQGKGVSPVGKASSPRTRIEKPRSLAISERGVKTGKDFTNLMSALMTDLLGGQVSASVGNAACNAGSKMLKVVEMQYKLGIGAGPNDIKRRQLTLAA